MRPVALALLLIFINFASSASLQSVAAKQEGNLVVAESRFPIADAPSQAEVVQQVVDFPPGAWTSPHSHGGQAVNLVLEGEITLRRGGVGKRYTAGQSWADSSGQTHAAGNTGEGKARLLTNFLLPKAAKQTTIEGASQLQPTVTYEARFPILTLPADAEIRQQVVDLAPGWRESKGNGGPVVNVVVEGEVLYRVNGVEKVYKAGQAWSQRAGVSVTEENVSGKKARVFTTYLLPKGASLIVTPVPAVPRSIDDASRPDDQGGAWLWPTLAATLLVGVATAVAAPLLMRRNRSS